MNWHFSVGLYTVNLYFPEHKSVIDCDKYDHGQKTINNQLNCQFIHYNPDAKVLQLKEF